MSHPLYAVTGASGQLGRLVTAFRLHIASRWIATTNLQLSEIAYASGFSSPSHFSARFRERFGMTAREYRDRLKHPA